MRTAFGVLLGLMIVACDGGEPDPVDAGGDATTAAPTLVSATPATGFPDAVLELTFSGPVALAALEAAVVVTDAAGSEHGTVVTGSGTTFSISPESTWAENQTHTLSVDLGGGRGTHDFAIGFCEQWTFGFPASPTVANADFRVQIERTSHGCAASSFYGAEVRVGGALVPIWAITRNGMPDLDPFEFSPAASLVELQLNLFCSDDLPALPADLDVEITMLRYESFSDFEPETLVPETASLRLLEAMVREHDTASTGVPEMPWDPRDDASVASAPWNGGTPATADTEVSLTVDATVYEPDGSASVQSFPVLVNVPAGYDADDASALHGLIFVMQGWGPSYTSTSGHASLLAEAATRGYLVVRPQGAWFWDAQVPGEQPRDPTVRGAFGCHVGYADYQMRHSDPLGSGLTPDGSPPSHNLHNWYAPVMSAITNEVVDTFTFDPKRVHAAGFSCGAAYALVLGAHYPDRFASVVADDPNPSPLVNLVDDPWTGVQVEATRRVRYFMIGGETSVGGAVLSAHRTFGDELCWTGEGMRVAGGHRWHMNELHIEALDFMSANEITPAELAP